MFLNLFIFETHIILPLKKSRAKWGVPSWHIECCSTGMKIRQKKKRTEKTIIWHDRTSYLIVVFIQKMLLSFDTLTIVPLCWVFAFKIETIRNIMWIRSFFILMWPLFCIVHNVFVFDIAIPFSNGAFVHFMLCLLVVGCREERVSSWNLNQKSWKTFLEM